MISMKIKMSTLDYYYCNASDINQIIDNFRSRYGKAVLLPYGKKFKYEKTCRVIIYKKERYEYFCCINRYEVVEGVK